MKMKRYFLVTVYLFIHSQSVIEACRSNTGTSAICAGALSDSCDDNCGCNRTSLLTCIDFKCACNLNSQGGFESTCNNLCQCKTVNGLYCLNNLCSCNATTQVWDTIKCYDIETVSSNCDKQIQAVPNFVSGSISAFGSTSKAAWRCSALTGAVYSPSYNQTTRQGKYIAILTAQTSSQASSYCKSIGGTRIMPKDSDEIIALLKKYQSLSFLIGAFIDPRDGVAYFDNGDKLSSSFYTASLTPGSTGSCLKLTTSASGVVSIVEHACNTALAFICQF